VTPPRFPVFEWPNDAGILRHENGLLVIALRTSLIMTRTEARKQVRQVIKEALALLLNCAVAEVDLFSQAGQPIKLLNSHQNIGLSISHEVGLSMVAINMQGPVGIDLMMIDSIPDESELPTLAVEYLGESVAQAILRQPIEGQKETFAIAWTAFEASLKAKGEALIEWSAERDKKLRNLHIDRLALADGYVGSVAHEAAL
jgi:4'-phosphopantetheinyl transferase